MKKDFAKMDAGRMNLTNKRLILKLIKQNQQISRSYIAKKTGLTPPSISRIADELVNKDKLIEYMGIGDSNGGRPPLILKLRNEKNYIIGIDLGATYIRGCLVDLSAKFISEIQVPTEIEKGFNSIIEKLIQVIDRLKNRKEEGAMIWGIGIGVAGLVNNKTGIIESSPDFGWSNINFREILSGRIDLPFFYDNSTRLMALGELNMSNHHNLKNFAVINVGYGIAAGLVIDGKPVKGHSGFAGEFRCPGQTGIKFVISGYGKFSKTSPNPLKKVRHLGNVSIDSIHKIPGTDDNIRIFSRHRLGNAFQYSPLGQQPDMNV